MKLVGHVGRGFSREQMLTWFQTEALPFPAKVRPYARIIDMMHIFIFIANPETSHVR